MREKAESILTQDAMRCNEHSEQVEEMKLMHSVHNGIQKGRRREKMRMFTYGGSALVAAAVAITFLVSSYLLPDIQVVTNRDYTATTKSWTDSDLFINTNSLKKSLENVLTNNLVQPVYQSVQKNGYRFEILGAVTDGRKVYIMYNIQNATDSEVTHVPESFYYGDQEVSGMSASTELAQEGDHFIEPGESKNFIYVSNLIASISYTQEANYQIAIGEGKKQIYLRVAFELDSNRFKDQIQTFDINQTIKIDGQKINVKKMVYTPLHTYMDLEYDSTNSKNIFQLIDPVLMGKAGEKSEKLFYPKILTSSNTDLFTDPHQSTLVFDSSKLENIDQISLKIAGISALEEDQMKIVVDLNKNQIIQAPDNDLKLQTVGAGDIVFERKIEKATSLKSSTIQLEKEYQDADGIIHNEQEGTASPFISFSVSPKDDEGMSRYPYHFGSEAVHYPQPLTIKIEGYWNPILEEKKWELYSQVR